MTLSMTGFAAKSIIIELNENKITVAISIKSLNSRFFEATCKLPYTLTHLETTFIKLFKTQLHRGHIYFTIHISSPNLLKSSIEPSITIVEGYIKAINQIKETFNIEGKLTIHDLLHFSNIFNIEEQGIDESSITLIFDTTKELITELNDARQNEGMVLQKDLEKRIINMQKEIKTIESASQALLEQQKIKLSQELNKLDGMESEAIEIRRQILYTALDKIDIHEEIVRFKSHLKNLTEHLKSPTIEKGKRLDFILQELFREINTIAAKCSDVAIGSHAINIKVELEKAREQVQNIV